MACWNAGIDLPPLAVIWCINEPPPADSPIAVILNQQWKGKRRNWVGSPPAREMYFCVHWSAASWSSRPTLATPPIFWRSSEAKNPKAPSCNQYNDKTYAYSVVGLYIDNRVARTCNQWCPAIFVLEASNYQIMILMTRKYHNLLQISRKGPQGNPQHPSQHYLEHRHRGKDNPPSPGISGLSRG